MAKQKKQDRSRQQKTGAADRSQEQAQKNATDAREHMGSPADVARKGKKPSFGHN